MTLMEAAMLIGGALLALLGFLAMANIPKLYIDARSDNRQALRAIGQVIELTEEAATGSDAGGPTWHPVVRFEDQDGHEHTFQARYGTAPSKWTVGDPVEVAYPPLKPGEAEVDHPFMTYHSVLVALVVGFVFLGFGTGLVLLAFLP